MSQTGQPQSPGRSTLLAKTLIPWAPSIDARRNDQPGIISGRNFRDMVDGPGSSFASTLVNFNLWDSATRGKINELRITTGMLYGTQTGVWKINPVSGLAEILLNIPVTNKFWPWTIAFVGGLYYIAQYDIGLWQYDPVNELVKHVTTPAGDVVRFVAASSGRLIYFTDTVVAISALDDGTNLTPDIATGAGAQSLGLVGGTAFRIEVISDGFLVYLSKGIIKGSFTTAAFAFSYTKHSEDVKLFSPNASLFVQGLGVVSVDNKGFYLTKQYNYETYGYPQPWEVDKSSYVKDNLITGMDQTLFGTIQIYYSAALQLLFFSFSSNLLQGLFQYTMVYDCVSKRWSTFDQQHYGIFETYSATNNIYTCSFMDNNGYMRAFVDTNFTDDYPVSPASVWDYIYRPGATDELVRKITDPAINGGVAVEWGFTIIYGLDDNAFAYSNYTAFGLYSMNDTTYSDTMNTAGDPAMDVSGSPILGYTNIDMYISGGIELFEIPFVLPKKGLDSNIVIGPWRYNDQQLAEETCSVESIFLGCQSTNGFTVSEDWNTMVATEDWNSLTGAEDWSLGSQVADNYNLTLISTADGFSTPIQGEENLDIFLDLTSSKLYKPIGYGGIYHNLRLDANDAFESYNLKTIDVTTSSTGVLQGG